MISRDDLDRARAVILGHVHRTPLLSVASLGARCGVELHVKCENLQKTGSYKPRGGLNLVARLDDFRIIARHDRPPAAFSLVPSPRMSAAIPGGLPGESRIVKVAPSSRGVNMDGNS